MEEISLSAVMARVDYSNLGTTEDRARLTAEREAILRNPHISAEDRARKLSILDDLIAKCD